MLLKSLPAVGAGWGCLDIAPFYLFIIILFLFFLPLCESVRYRLKYCLKGQLSPKQPNK